MEENNELDRLVARVRASAGAHVDATIEHERRLQRRKVAIAVLLALVLAGSAVVGWRLAPASSGITTSGITTAVHRAVHDTVAKLVGAVGASNQSQAETAAAGAPQSEPSAQASHPRQHKADASIVRASAADARRAAANARVASLTEWSAGQISRDLLVVPQVAAGAWPMEENPEPARIYSRQDGGVTAPVPMKPLPGRVTPDATVRPGDIEVVVGRTGVVERVRLLSPGRFQDYFLIQAIKNHEFKPAIAHGMPVRYLLRMRTSDQP